jgi:4a-hydroxytetrahydrobiopterin dehydratase
VTLARGAERNDPTALRTGPAGGGGGYDTLGVGYQWPMTRLSHDDVELRLGEIPGWGIAEGALHREIELRNFVEAFGFMTMVAIEAEKLNHHPNWSNVWNKVVIDISSHSEGGITDLCFQLATAVNRALGE